jgi:hypothetical protein
MTSEQERVEGSETADADEREAIMRREFEKDPERWERAIPVEESIARRHNQSHPEQ